MQQEAVDKCISLIAGLDNPQAKSASLNELEKDQSAYWALQQQVADQLGLKIAACPPMTTEIDSSNRKHNSSASIASIQEDDEHDDADQIENLRSEKEILIATLFATALDELREDPAFSGTSEQIQLLRDSLTVGEMQAKVI